MESVWLQPLQSWTEAMGCGACGPRPCHLLEGGSQVNLRLMWCYKEGMGTIFHWRGNGKDSKNWQGQLSSPPHVNSRPSQTSQTIPDHPIVRGEAYKIRQICAVPVLVVWLLSSSSSRSAHLWLHSLGTFLLFHNLCCFQLWLRPAHFFSGWHFITSPLCSQISLIQHSMPRNKNYNS